MGELTEEFYWKPTPQLRWYRPAGASDNECKLQQLWRINVRCYEWRDVDLVMDY